LDFSGCDSDLDQVFNQLENCRDWHGTYDESKSLRWNFSTKSEGSGVKSGPSGHLHVSGKGEKGSGKKGKGRGKGSSRIAEERAAELRQRIAEYVSSGSPDPMEFGAGNLSASERRFVHDECQNVGGLLTHTFGDEPVKNLKVFRDASSAKDPTEEQESPSAQGKGRKGRGQRKGKGKGRGNASSSRD